MASANFTYSKLTAGIATPGSIRNWAQYSLIPADQILEEAQQFIYSLLRIQDMVTSVLVSIPPGGSSIALPTGFLDPIGLKLHGDSRELDYVQENLFGRYVDEDGTMDTGRPQRWTLFDNLIQFDVANDDDAALAGVMLYYKEPTYLAAAPDGPETNFLTDRFGRLLRQTCVAVAYEHRRRPEAASEYLLAEKAIAEANRVGDMRRRGQIMR